MDTGLSVTPLMGHLGCLASHWRRSIPVSLEFCGWFWILNLVQLHSWAIYGAWKVTGVSLCLNFCVFLLCFTYRPHRVGSSIVVEVVQVPILGLLRPLDWNSRGPVLFFLGFLAFNFKLLSFFLFFFFKKAPWFLN